MANGKNDIRVERSADPLWWGIAAILGAICAWVCHALVGGDRTNQDMVELLGFFFCGLFLGFIRTSGYWQWGFATILSLPAFDLARVAYVNPAATLTFDQAISVIQKQSPDYGLHAAVAIFGAWLGAYWGRV